MRQSFINGMNLVGIAIALYSFSVLLDTTGWVYRGYIFATLFMLGAAIEEFISGLKQNR